MKITTKIIVYTLLSKLHKLACILNALCMKSNEDSALATLNKHLLSQHSISTSVHENIHEFRSENLYICGAKMKW